MCLCLCLCDVAVLPDCQVVLLDELANRSPAKDKEWFDSILFLFVVDSICITKKWNSIFASDNEFRFRLIFFQRKFTDVSNSGFPFYYFWGTFCYCCYYLLFWGWSYYCYCLLFWGRCCRRSCSKLFKLVLPSTGSSFSAALYNLYLIVSI